ncbi:hypothetical protein Pan265_16460 [Mucisphaera calidilacus]|uniref:Uncharacterized protein n=2 Tax=Mucisphaera calidilacus TaxID=2527982 RepID=A0A518BXT9_9BACT|nr:hypothetical protein Pan265_16460 [Mucisphaera calidilacus]
MHFAVGMLGGGVLGVAVAAVVRRGTRWVPLAMTAGGFWALVPDLPRLWREDFPGLPLASVLGDKELERSLHGVGDLFFLHARLDAQPREYALHGLILILFLYNLALMWQILFPPKALVGVDTRLLKARRRGPEGHRPPVLSEHLERETRRGDEGPAVIGRIEPGVSAGAHEAAGD